MHVLIIMIEWLTFASVGIGLIKSYLTVNKIWTRKSDVNVAQSISVYAAILGLVATIPFFLKYLIIDQDFLSAFNAGIGLVVGVFFFLVGIGYWTRESAQKISLWRKFIRSVKRENDEASDLLKAMVQPHQADKIVEILHLLAHIDNQLDQKESAFIEQFARTWSIRLDADKGAEFAAMEQHSRFISLRDKVNTYLMSSPPEDQVAQLRDAIHTLINIDKDLSDDESLILQEIEGLFDNYSSDGKSQTRYEVYLVPQSDEQTAAIESLIGHSEKGENLGGQCILVDSYFSFNYAKMLCDQYRSLNLMTVMEVVEA